jgi:hypothetical protein
MRQPLLAVETQRFESAVAQHLQHLGVFLPFFFEGELALFVVIFVLAATAVFTTLDKFVLVVWRAGKEDSVGERVCAYLSLVLGHVECVVWVSKRM